VQDFEADLLGRRVMAIGRRGKYLIVCLDEGYLLIHLKMSGRLQVVSNRHPFDKHVHVLLGLDNDHELRFHDVRKFGRIYLVDDPLQVTARLGPEPLADEFTLDDFRERLERRSGRLKSLLLNQEFLAGVGNIYADEVLFVARLHPLRKADSLRGEEQDRLYEAIRSVLRQAIGDRGTTLSDRGYTDAEGEAGSYQEQINVYGRAGEPCPRCHTPLQRIVVGGRSTHFCPRCQN
jgi:formamidopyrimidine-DNA glycosylase